MSGALLITSHGFVVAADLSGALVAAAIRHGVRVLVPARARHIERQGDGISIHLENDASVTANHVVLAAGSWSGDIGIAGIPSLPIRPIRGQLLQLATDGPPLRRIVWGPRCYLVPASRGSVLVGATVEDAGFDERTTVAGVRDLLDSACDLVPQLWRAAFVGARVGLRPATTDGLPIIGRSAIMRTRVCDGHYRNGVLLAPLTARAVADLVLDNRDDPLLMAAAPQRFGSIDMAILSDDDVQRQLKNLKDWTVEGHAIRKQYTFNDFPAAIAFVNRLVPDAEAADHHPDIGSTIAG